MRIKQFVLFKRDMREVNTLEKDQMRCFEQNDLSLQFNKN